MSVFLELGQRPDEPGPPIHGRQDLSGRRRGAAGRPTPQQIIARYPQRAVGAAAAAAPGAVRGRLPHPGGHRVLRRPTRPDRRRGHRGRHVLLDVPAHADRRVPGRGVHQHAVRDHGRRRDSRSAARPSGHPRRPDHRRRPGHPRARRVQRGVRLRAGRDGQLGVLRQPDAVVGPRSRRRTARGRTPGADPRRAAVHVPGDRQNPCRTARSGGSAAAGQPARPRSPACGSPRSGAWRHRTRRTHRTSARCQPDDTKAAAEATKDEPAPAPSATVPAEPSTPETDPDATDSKHDPTDSRAEPVLGRARALVDGDLPPPRRLPGAGAGAGAWIPTTSSRR